MQVALYPYGNAHESQNPDGSWKFECQHGTDECLGNLLEVCVMAHLDWDFNSYLPVISCMEGADNPVEAARGCVKYLSNLPFKAVKACAKGPEGNTLMHTMANKTESLEPTHKYVPWVVVQGNHTEELEQKALDDLVGLVCEMYQGKKPAQCFNRGPTSNQFIQKDWVEERKEEQQLLGKQEMTKDEVENETYCVMCKFIASTIDREVADKKNVKEIEAALEVICSYLPSSKMKRCDNIVEAYTELIIDMLTQDISPEMLCEALGLCPKRLF